MSDQLQTMGTELLSIQPKLQIDDDKLRAMDARADNVIANWSMGALGANLLPPPFDMVAVGGVFAGMGARLASIYEVEMDRTTLKHLGVAVARGVGAVVAAGYFGTNLLKFVPGVNIGIALLIQPPIVAAVAYSAGHAFKQYFHVVITEGRGLSPEQVRALAESALRSRLSGRVNTWLQRLT